MQQSPLEPRTEVFMQHPYLDSPIGYFSQDFRDFLRSNNFPEILFHNACAYFNVLNSEQYKHLCEEYERIN